jgi:hypothetical protein
MKNKKYYKVGTITKSNIKIVERGKIDTPITQIHNRSFSSSTQRLCQCYTKYAPLLSDLFLYLYMLLKKAKRSLSDSLISDATYKWKVHNGKIEIISFVVKFCSKATLTQIRRLF